MRQLAWEITYKSNSSRDNSDIVYGGFILCNDVLKAEYNSRSWERVRSREFTLRLSGLPGATCNSKIHGLLDVISLTL